MQAVPEQVQGQIIRHQHQDGQQRCKSFIREQRQKDNDRAHQHYEWQAIPEDNSLPAKRFIHPYHDFIPCLPVSRLVHFGINDLILHIGNRAGPFSVAGTACGLGKYPDGYLVAVDIFNDPWMDNTAGSHADV